MSSWLHPPVLPAGLSLASLPLGQPCTVLGVQAPPDRPEWASALDELGFVPGESVQLMARGLPGGDPLVVRVGCSTYALRGAEAACVIVGRQAAGQQAVVRQAVVRQAAVQVPSQVESR